MSDNKMAKSTPPLIVFKYKTGHSAHHGGAWKVAYADFVTAMMALFIVLWLLSSSEKVKKAIGGYFLDPHGTAQQIGTDQFGTGQAMPVKRDDMPKLRERLESAMKKMENFSRIHQQVQMTITAEGLRIELMETKGGFFFENGSSAATPQMKELLGALAKEIGSIPNHVLIEGHTDAAPFLQQKNYSNWELSLDRANSARQLMESSGLKPEQVSQLRGFADRRLKYASEPTNPGNRRISLVIQYRSPDGSIVPENK